MVVIVFSRALLVRAIKFGSIWFESFDAGKGAHVGLRLYLLNQLTESFEFCRLDRFPLFESGFQLFGSPWSTIWMSQSLSERTIEGLSCQESMMSETR